MNLLVAFSIGFFGSLHCLGMCGPIAMALPFGREVGIRRFTGNYIYQVGRITTYFAIGLLAGIVGKGFSLAGLQQPFSIFMGGLMILITIIPSISHKIGSTHLAGRWLIKVKNKLGPLFKKKNFKSYYVAGLLNGLLPCGLIYIAVMGSMSMQGPISGGLFMLFFGLGTFPMMYIIPLLPILLGSQFKKSFKRVVPVFVVALGILLVVRGLGLDIPYLSPNTTTLTTNNPSECK